MKIKKKLKDITIKEYIDWKEKNCSYDELVHIIDNYFKIN